MIKLSESILAVDPGCPFGWAFFPSNRFRPYAAKVESQTPGSQFEDWLERSKEAAYDIGRAVRRFHPDWMAIEWPIHMGASVKGIAAAEAGSIIKLSVTIGRMIEVAQSSGVKIKAVPTGEWMGQMNGLAVRERVKRKLGDDECLKLGLTNQPSNIHAWDAIGIGLHVRAKW